MIKEATKACSMCGVEYALSAFPPRRRQCRVCRHAYTQRWRAGIRVSRYEYVRTMQRAKTTATRVDLGDRDRGAAIEYAVELYRAGSKDPSPADVLDAIEPDSSDRHAPGYARWREMVDRVIRAEKEGR